MKCKKCGNELEFYTKERYKGYCENRFRTDGKDAENYNMYDSAEHRFVSKFVFCDVCHARVCTIDELEL